ncbi:MAG: hypothetical protein ACLSAF_04530 [Intestinimonas sp.]
MVIGLGVMLATGGSAVVARKLGEGDEETACRDLTLLVLTGAALGTLFSCWDWRSPPPCPAAGRSATPC